MEMKQRKRYALPRQKVAKDQKKKCRKQQYSDKHGMDNFTSYEEAVQNVINIDTFDEGKLRSQVRVIISYPNRLITVRQVFNQTMGSLLRSIALHYNFFKFLSKSDGCIIFCL